MSYKKFKFYVVQLSAYEYSSQTWRYICIVYSGTKAACEKYVKTHIPKDSHIKADISLVES